MDIAIERLLRRDRVFVLGGLAGISGLCWIYLFSMAGGMAGNGAGDGGSMMIMGAWSAADAVMMFLMWAIMMVAMMLPSAAPMTLIYARVERKARSDGRSVAPISAFVGGYTAMWVLFSVGATVAQWGLSELSLLSPMMVSTSADLGAALLIGAGAYQLTPLKEACLDNCRSPVQFLSEHWRPGTGGAFRLGAHHGAYCLGCCWVLMGLLFVGGVMNLIWIAAIALFVLGEKVLPFGVWAGRLAGGAMIATGGALLAGFSLG